MSTKRAIESYAVADGTFASTREAKFLTAITDAFDQGDAEEYTGAVAEYDRWVLSFLQANSSEKDLGSPRS